MSRTLSGRGSGARDEPTKEAEDVLEQQGDRHQGLPDQLPRMRDGELARQRLGDGASLLLSLWVVLRGGRCPRRYKGLRLVYGDKKPDEGDSVRLKRTEEAKRVIVVLEGDAGFS